VVVGLSADCASFVDIGTNSPLVLWYVDILKTLCAPVEDQEIHASSVLHFFIASAEASRHDTSGLAIQIFLKGRKEIDNRCFRAFCSPL